MDQLGREHEQEQEHEQDFVILGDRDVFDYNEPGILPLSPEKLKEIRSWLQPTDYLSGSSEFKKHLSAFLPGTGEWIRDTDEYRKWHSSTEAGSLWIKAIPGAGKSVLAASSVAHLGQTERIPVLYFFFRQIITTNRKPVHLLRDWLSQVLEHSPPLQMKLHAYVKSDRAFNSITFEELWQVLVDALSLLPKVYCISDALDEMEIGNEAFLGQLLNLGRHKPATIKVIMTSRIIPRIEEVLRHSTVVHLSLFEKAVNRDIQYYVEKRLQDTTVPKASCELIQTAMGQKAQGLFLYARLMLDDILNPTRHNLEDSEATKKMLNELPNSLTDMYGTLLADYSTRTKTPRETQFVILQWVTQSSRPLRLLELAGLIDYLNNPKDTSQETKDVVASACGPLLEILEDGTVSIIHHSLTEYLTDESRNGEGQFPVIARNAAQKDMALICLQYISSGILDDWKVDTMRDEYDIWRAAKNTKPADLTLQHPFLGYALEKWHHHFADSSDETLFAALDKFMHVDSKAFLAWLDMSWPGGPLKDITPLHVAAFTGMSNYTWYLLQKGENVEARESVKKTPLIFAAMNGHVDVVSTLLENGANKDCHDSLGMKPILYAADNNHSAVVDVLLQAGVDPMTEKHSAYRNPRRSKDDTAIEYTAKNGHVPTMRVLMKYLDVDGLTQALYWATMYGKTRVVRCILENSNVDVNRTCRGTTPLFCGAARRDPSLIKLLLDQGADVNAKCYPQDLFPTKRSKKEVPYGLYAIHAFCGCGIAISVGSLTQDECTTKQAFQLLYNAGCDINQQGIEKKTPLHCVASISSKPYRRGIMPLLLEHGANVMAEDDNGNTPLHSFIYPTPEDIHLLCKHGANVNAARELDKGSPLHTFLLNGVDKDCISALLSYQPDPNNRNVKGDTALHQAVTSVVDGEVLEMLIEAGYDVNARNLNLDTPMHNVRLYHSDTKSMSTMIKAKADLEAKNILGNTTLLQAAISQPSKYVLKAFIEAGVNVNARNYKGTTTLHILASNIANEQMAMLIEAGADPLVIDNAGNTILHEASRSQVISDEFQSKIALEFLFDLLGSAAHSKNQKGRTVLHAAASTKSSRWAPASLSTILQLGRSTEKEITLNEQSCALDVNAKDNKLETPIHLAARTSADMVDQLIQAGADPTVITAHGYTPLHIACQAGQSDTVGLLLECYAKLSRSDLVNAQDHNKRTPLFAACASGRLASVKLLLSHGAKIDVLDKDKCSPLDACAEFQDEAACEPRNAPKIRIGEDGNNMRGASPNPDGIWRVTDYLGDIPPGIRQIIRLLVAQGDKPDLSIHPNLAQHQLRETRRTMRKALCAANEVMVEELKSLISATNFEEEADDDEDGLPHTSVGCNSYPFERDYLALRGENLPRLLERIVKPGEDNYGLINDLLSTDNEDAVLEAVRLGADLLKLTKEGKSGIEVIAERGHVSLMRKVGHQVATIDQAWLEEEIKKRLKDPLGMTPFASFPLHAACGSEFPNWDMVSLLVTEFKVNVNAYLVNYNLTPGDEAAEPTFTRGVTALHVLAQGSFWWQASAMQILIDHGADVEAQDVNGDTPLSAALQHRYPASYWRKNTLEVLLRAGANPNVVSKYGKSCLNHAAHSVDLVRMLLKHGADITIGNPSPLFSSIDDRNIESLRVYLSSGADCNIFPIPEKSEYEAQRDMVKTKDEDVTARVSSQKMYPLHLVATNAMGSSEDKAAITPIINLLLEHGADPHKSYPTGIPIIHHLVVDGGLLDPFFDKPGLIDLERRDSLGRTLLLASCNSRRGWNLEYLRFGNDAEPPFKLISEALLIKGANYEARDNEGLSVLHHSMQSAYEYEEVLLLPHLAKLLEHPSACKVIQCKDNKGATALHYALRNGRILSVEALIAKGANPLESDPDGNTALHHLAQKMYEDAPLKEGERLSDGEEAKAERRVCDKQRELFDALLAQGLDINARNNDGLTPLFVFMASNARFEDDESYMRLLPFFLERGADPKMRNNKGETILHTIAKRAVTDYGYGVPSARKALKAAFKKFAFNLGVDATLEDAERRSALDLAAAYGHGTVVRLFQRRNLVASGRTEGAGGDAGNEDDDSEEED